MNLTSLGDPALPWGGDDFLPEREHGFCFKSQSHVVLNESSAVPMAGKPGIR